MKPTLRRVAYLMVATVVATLLAGCGGHQTQAASLMDAHIGIATQNESTRV
jgi:hypothetical protein